MRLLLMYMLLLAATMGQSVFGVTVAWLTLHVTGTIASVGMVMVWRPILNLTIGPFLGVIVDRYNRSGILVLGMALNLVGIAWLLVNLRWYSLDQIGIATIAAPVCVAFLGNLLSAPSAQALLQLIAARSLTRTVSTAVAGVQVGDILGVLFGGLAIAAWGFAWSLAISAVGAIVAAAVAMALHREGRIEVGAKGPGYFAAVTDGFRLIFHNQRLLLACIAIALTWSMSYFTMGLLAPFTRIELGLGASAFGWIDAMWGVGAFMASIALSRFAGPQIIHGLLAFGLPGLAISVLCFSTAESLWSAMAFHALMGFAFGLSRTAYDIYILATIGNRTIGRVRNNIDAFIGIGGIVTFLSPGLYAEESVRAVYITYAMVLLVLAGLLALWRNLVTAPENLDSLT
jgi:Na+/melibiose symporter-like transporter